jgi:toxin ParE1/3/4
LKIHIILEAAEEIDSARSYFNQQAYALGDRFLDDIEEALKRIEQDPFSLPLLETCSESMPYRRALLKVFRYAVVFEILTDQVLVVAVCHTSRAPHYWLKRRES